MNTGSNSKLKVSIFAALAAIALTATTSWGFVASTDVARVALGENAAVVSVAVLLD